jgi:meso-butanediol dehydrogenase/(S,S)-butanediol dehydrogenase/diacetyl reductase
MPELACYLVAMPSRRSHSRDLEGAVAMITGAGGGIGAALLPAFAEAGAAVVAVDCNGPAVRRSAEASGAARWIEADVSEESAVRNLVSEVSRDLGTVDILVNCAAVALKGPIESFSVEDWDRTMNVNARGTFLMCRAVLPGMLDKRRGRIINFSSIDGRKGRAGACAYSASKFAIIGFTESLANEVTRHGITANAVLPAGVATPMWSVTHPDKRPETVLAPEDLADVVLFLAGSGGRHISGAAIDVFGKRLQTRGFELG